MQGDRLTPIEFSSSTSGPTVELVIRGELDPHTAPQLDDELAALIHDDGVTTLVLDVAGIDFIDSSGLRSLIRAQQTIAARGGAVVLRAPSAATLRLLEITNLEPQFEIA